jgi:hypothetical protein
MLFGGRTIQWPESDREWAIWAVLILSIFVIWRIVAGWPVAVLATAAAVGGYAVEGHLTISPALLATGLLLVLIDRRRAIEHDARRVVTEVILVSAGFLAYELGRYWSEGSYETARRNAGRVVDLERRLGLAFEAHWQGYVLRHDFLVDLFNRIYSYFYIPFVLCALFWLLVTDDSSYRLLRNSLGISAALAVTLIALFPVAPPRLMPELGIVDSHELAGLAHGFVNEFAAVPSLHVGWMTLTGYVLYRSLANRHRRSLAALSLLPPMVMSVTVIVTGNHYWFDGAVGIAIALGPALVMMHRAAKPQVTGRAQSRPFKRLQSAMAAASYTIATTGWVRFTVGSLAALLAYLTVGQMLDPGFTDYWGYMVAQIAATIAAVIWLSTSFADVGGLSPITHVIVVAVTYLDTFGTAGHMYERFVTYDKIAHFGGAAALAAASYDVLFALDRRGTIRWSVGMRAVVAMGVATVLGGCWEIYEFSADLLFHTYRHAGRYDTIYDLISDATGAAVTSLYFYRRELQRREPETQTSLDQGQASQA